MRAPQNVFIQARPGFSLLEVILSLGLGALVLGMALQAMTQQHRTEVEADMLLKEQLIIDQVHARIANDIRNRMIERQPGGQLASTNAVGNSTIRQRSSTELKSIWVTEDCLVIKTTSSQPLWQETFICYAPAYRQGSTISVSITDRLNGGMKIPKISRTAGMIRVEGRTADHVTPQSSGNIDIQTASAIPIDNVVKGFQVQLHERQSSERIENWIEWSVTTSTSLNRTKSSSMKLPLDRGLDRERTASRSR